MQKSRHAIHCTGIEDTSLGPPKGRLKPSKKASRNSTRFLSSILMSKAPKMTPKVVQFRLFVQPFWASIQARLETYLRTSQISQKSSSGHQYWLKLWPPGLKTFPKVTSRSQARTRRFKQHCSGPLDLVLGTWYLVLGTWYLVLGTWYLVLGTW